MISKKKVEKTIQDGAWRNLSEYFCWTDELLEKYQDQLDWELVSRNKHILWTSAMLEKYKNRIDWTNMASSNRKTIINVENLRRFKDYWDWGTLSEEAPLTYEIIDEFTDKLDWKLVSQNEYISWTPEMLDKYKNRLDWTEFTSSRTMIIDVENHVENHLDWIEITSSRAVIIDVENLRRFKDYWDWEKLSEEARLTDEIIDEFTDKLDWKLVSQNEFISWTPEMLDKYKNRLDWTAFTSSRTTIIDGENLRRFKDYWDWEKLSKKAPRIYETIIDEFIDKWDWAQLINSGLFDVPVQRDMYALAFVDKYFDYISQLNPEDFEGSNLAQCLSNREGDKIAKEIVFSRSSC